MPNTQTALFTLRGVPVVEGTCLRILQEERKDDLYYYNLRHGDIGWHKPVSVEHFVMVNHYGTIATTESLDQANEDENFYLELTDEEQDLISRYI